MNQKPENKVIEFFNEHHVLTIASSSDNQPYCANCFYTYIEDKNIFVFSSDDDTRHAKEFRKNPNVAASIVLETKTIGKIQGTQILGQIKEAQNEELKMANKAYLKAFPFAILKSTKLWILDVNYIKMTDNRLGFGKKLIWKKE